MKRSLLSLILVLSMLVSMIMAVSAADITLTPADVDSYLNVRVKTTDISTWNRNNYAGFNGVNMTGIKSITAYVEGNDTYWSNGEAFAVKIDDPVSGECLGYITICNDDGHEYTANIKETSGVHNLYFVGCYGKYINEELRVRHFTLHEDEFTGTNAKAQVSDTYVTDNYHDTWTAVDDMGRKVADYSETGPVKPGKHDVGMLYWDWFSNGGNDIAYVTSKILEKHPEIKEDYYNEIWDVNGRFWWAEPLLGFYDSYDYWVYRRHSEMLADAGVDFIAFDYSNVGIIYSKALHILAQAFRDSKKEGIKVPKITAMTSLGGNSDDSVRLLKAIYLSCFKWEDYTDIWYYLDEKPMLYGSATPAAARTSVLSGDVAEMALLDDIESFFTYRTNGSRNGPSSLTSNQWLWLEDFPIHKWNWQEDTGRYEYNVIGVGINESYIYKKSATGVFSDEYTKGRGFSEVFGEDYTENGKRMAYFFRDQSAMSLAIDPEIVMIDGWNEWTTVRNDVYGGFKNSFVDNFDDENSRDFEPSAGVLKDDYYNLLADFTRKYKGVRKVMTASEPVTIDINGGVSEWDGVGPEYLSWPFDLERNSYGFGKEGTGEKLHFTTTVANSIVKAKVARDNNNFYFLAETKNPLDISGNKPMQLYINTDRNPATGWSGYDIVLNRTNLGTVEKNVADKWEWESIGACEYATYENTFVLSVPRVLVGENDTVDFEFKWVDGIDASGDVLNFYKDGNTAPTGRFNYLYTEKEQKHPGDAYGNTLDGIAVLDSSKNKMVVGKSALDVYEPDTSFKPVMIDGAMYVPEDTINEIIGYGMSKTWYDGSSNSFYLMKYDYNEDVSGVGSTDWMYTAINSLDVRLNGETAYLTNPVRVIKGLIYVPVTLLSDCLGWNVSKTGDSTYVLKKPGAVNISAATVSDLLTYMN